MIVLLVNPPIRLPRVFGNYPLLSTFGPLVNAAWLRQKGHDVRFVDAFTLSSTLNLRPDGGEFRHVGAEIADLIEAARDKLSGSREHVVIIVATTTYSPLIRLDETLIRPTIQGLREAFPDTTIGLADLFVTGMNYYYFSPEQIMERLPDVTFALVGEAEQTLPELLRRLQTRESLKGLPRVGVRTSDGAICYNPASPATFKPLDQLPLPAFDLIDMDNYFSVQADAIRADLVHEYHTVERQMPFQTSRSCPYQCSFCTNQVLRLPWRPHSVRYVLDAMRTLGERYQVDRFLLLDDNINVNERRFRELVVGLRDLGIPWDAVNGFRADHLDRAMVQAMKDAGNAKVTVSAESGDPKVVDDLVHKRLKLSSVVKLAKTCHEERIPLQIHYMVGIPGETKTQMNRTLEFATELLWAYAAWPLLQHAFASPGTELYEVCEQNGYFATPPLSLPLDAFEAESIIRTPQFTPGEVERIKRNAQALHRRHQQVTFLEVTSKCDGACVSCHGTRPADAPEPTLSHIHEQLEEGRFRGARDLMISGGEPTMRDDLPQIMRKAREMGFAHIALLTNAHGLGSPSRAEAIFREGLDSAAVDLFSYKANLHDELAGQSGAFAFMLAGVRSLLSHGVSFDVHVPILVANLEDLTRTVQLAFKLRAGGVKLLMPTPVSKAARAGHAVRWEDAKEAVLKAVRTAPRGKVQVQGVPLCWLPQAPGVLQPLPPWELRKSLKWKTKPRACTECVAYMVCGGLPREQQ